MQTTAKFASLPLSCGKDTAQPRPSCRERRSQVPASGGSTGITCFLGLRRRNHVQCTMVFTTRPADNVAPQRNSSVHDGLEEGFLMLTSQAPRSLLRPWMLFTDHGAHGAYATSRRKCCRMLATDYDYGYPGLHWHAAVMQCFEVVSWVERCRRCWAWSYTRSTLVCRPAMH